MQKTKILFLIHTLQVGGAEKALVNLVNNLDPRKFDITVMTVIDTGAFRAKLSKNIHYKTIIRIPGNKKQEKNSNKSGNLFQDKNNLKTFLAKIYSTAWKHINLKNFYRRHFDEKYDIEIAFLEGIATKIIAHSNNPASKKYAWVHVDLINERKSEHFFRNRQEESNTYKKFDKIIAVSQTVKDQFEKKFNFNPEDVIVKYNIIDSDEITKLANQEIPKNNFTICSVGRLSRQKGYDRLLKAVQKLNSQNLKFDVWIIGVGAEEGKLQDFIKKNHLDNVYLLGYKSNPYPYIKSADLYVCSSRAEGFSTTVTEAVILGTPIIAVDCSGMHEILDNSKYGLICKNSTTALYNTIKGTLQNPKQYKELRKRVIKRQSFFNTRTSLNEIEKFLYEVTHA